MNEQEHTVVPVWVHLDGENGIFDSYLPIDEAERIQECGLANAGCVILRETDDKPIPQRLVDGLTDIVDLWVVTMRPNVPLYLN